jgi:protein SDA1
MRYGERKIASGVAGADLLVEYESKKAAHLKKMEENPDAESGDEEEGQELENFDEEEGESGDEDEVEEEGDDEEEEVMEMESGDNEEAPDLVVHEEAEGEEKIIDLSKMTQEERDKLKQHVSSTRVFTAGDFEKMRRLVEREERAKRDPREAARRKRAIAQGREFEELSDEESVADSDDEEIRISGAINPGDIMAEAKRKRTHKAEKLKKIIAGRDAFESKERAGGSTNIEKSRKKNFLMSKSSREARSKGRGKGGLSQARGNSTKKEQTGREAKKRRRKL